MIYRDITQEQLVRLVTQAVREQLRLQGRLVPVGISMRHIHLSRREVDALFGRTYQLTPLRPLSQPGQFACQECLDVIGPKGVLHKVRILGPERPQAQVELAQTDCRTIGVKAPVRASGNVEGTPGVLLQGPRGVLSLPQGVIIADRHLHMSTAQAAAFGLKDGDTVRIQVGGGKPGILDGVLVRAGDQYELDLHLDTDDANAFQLKQGQLVTVLE
ncbi:phosphate propanoyltransferase [Pseudoflavonifractor sp. 60]|uniref:phosphate propanoyltransferase n=1 Tax=Pseudoflavonifractor sp. 60 TaxID=2304576 RepID=UPI0013692B40|nr:phosphate propanoyltransferase [Pseudoflavonifractor sp. 60]NBI66256.1 phosphate propanoyltransferase [Pseudoflavonifractor sp. 60]